MKEQYQLQCQNTERVTMFINLSSQQAHAYNKMLERESSGCRLRLVNAGQPLYLVDSPAAFLKRAENAETDILA